MLILSRFTTALFRIAPVALALAVLAPQSVWSQQQQGAKKELSEKVSEELGKIRTHTDAKNYDAAIAIIDSLLKGVGPDSYDMAVLSQVKATILLTKGDYTKSIQPLETALTVSDRHGFLDAKQTQEVTYYLAQLYYQETTTTKDAALLKKYLQKAITYIERWIKNSPKSDPEKQLFLATVLYTESQLDQNNIDMALIKRAQQEAEKGLLLSVKPKDTFYILLLATLQHQNDNHRAAELLELLVKNYPKNKTYWAQLAATYLNLQQDVRAALTIERAQKHDTMNTPRDNFNLVGIYFNMQQFEQAIDLLSKGLRDGSIDKDQKNWELLVASLQQVKKEMAAIDVLKEAIKIYPESGSLYHLAAQIYYTLDKLEDSYRYAKLALSKKLDKPWQTQTFLAYICYELKKLDEAMAAINAAMANPEGSKEAERLKKAIEEAQKEKDVNHSPTPSAPTNE